MICLSPSGSTKLIDCLCDSEDHDVEVLFWCDALKEATVVMGLCEHVKS